MCKGGELNTVFQTEPIRQKEEKKKMDREAFFFPDGARVCCVCVHVSVRTLCLRLLSFCLNKRPRWWQQWWRQWRRLSSTAPWPVGIY